MLLMLNTVGVTAWVQVQGLQKAYEDVLLRVPAAGNPDDMFTRIDAFVKLEATMGCGPTPGSVYPRVASYQLEELMYRVVAALRCAVQADHPDG